VPVGQESTGCEKLHPSLRHHTLPGLRWELGKDLTKGLRRPYFWEENTLLVSPEQSSANGVLDQVGAAVEIERAHEGHPVHIDRFVADVRRGGYLLIGMPFAIKINTSRSRSVD
jgi:hypothetical protein